MSTEIASFNVLMLVLTGWMSLACLAGFARGHNRYIVLSAANATTFALYLVSLVTGGFA